MRKFIQHLSVLHRFDAGSKPESLLKKGAGFILFLFCLGFLAFFGFTEYTQATSTPYSFLKIKPFNSINSIVYRCEDLGGGRYKLTSTSGSTVTRLLDTTAMLISECAFTCNTARNNDVPLINIKLKMQPAVASPLVEQSTPITFETSVTMRNYQR